LLLLQLDVVEKGLNDFLETKKMAFPRWVPAALAPAAAAPAVLPVAQIACLCKPGSSGHGCWSFKWHMGIVGHQDLLLAVGCASRKNYVVSSKVALTALSR
jgi:hypothetical protein